MIGQVFLISAVFLPLIVAAIALVSSSTGSSSTSSSNSSSSSTSSSSTGSSSIDCMPICSLDRTLARQAWIARLAWLGVGLALVTAVYVLVYGPFIVSIKGTAGQPSVGLWASPLTVTLLVLVCVVSAVVQSFSVRYLQADRASFRFFAASNVLVSAMALVCTSLTIPVLVVAWVVAGLGFVAVVGYRSDYSGVKASIRRTLAMFVVGDSALVAALVIIGWRVGNVDLAATSTLGADRVLLGNLSTVVALFVVIAALTRSAQGPFGRWLPGTVSAPTPVSALLHAGVVNGGGILLIRLGVLTGDSALAMVVAFSVAGLTATIAAGVMTRKPDVKGTLVFSTMAQMGFMIAECAVGAYLAALVHLIGHAMYKATLFFGSGSQITRIGQAPIPVSNPMPVLMRTLATGITTAVAVGAMVAIPGVLAHRGADILLAFVASSATSAGWHWWKRCPRSNHLKLLWTSAIVIAGALYGLVLGGMASWIAPTLPTVGSQVLSPWWLLTIVGLGLVMAGLTRLPLVHDRLCAVLVEAGTPPLDSLMKEQDWPSRRKHGTGSPVDPIFDYSVGPSFELVHSQETNAV